jgi:hypothetical protein
MFGFAGGKSEAGHASGDGMFPKLTEAFIKENCRSSTYKVASRYVNGNDVGARLYVGRFISGTVRGKRSVYHVRVYIDEASGKLESECGCSSDRRLCRHGAAVALAYATQGATFFDLSDWVEKLAAMDKDELKEFFIRTATKHPSMLGAFGVHGMEEMAPKPRTRS